MFKDGRDTIKASSIETEKVKAKPITTTKRVQHPQEEGTHLHMTKEKEFTTNPK